MDIPRSIGIYRRKRSRRLYLRPVRDQKLASAAPERLCQMLKSAPGSAAAGEKYLTASATASMVVMEVRVMDSAEF